MMYINNAFLLSTAVIKNEGLTGGISTLEPLVSRKVPNGLIFKDQWGNSLKTKTGKQSADVHVILDYYQEVFGVETRRAIRLPDDLARRIVAYMQDYYGVYHTNCSTLVEYLRTGIFTECDVKRKYFMSSSGMNRFVGQKIRPYDSLCVFYYDDRCRSRKFPTTLRNHYRSCVRNATGDLTKLAGAELNVSAEELLDYYRVGMFLDYHFMFCIGINNGQPVFIQQMGENDPRARARETTPIVVSVGMTNMSHRDVPAFVFVKRGML